MDMIQLLSQVDWLQMDKEFINGKRKIEKTGGAYCIRAVANSMCGIC